MSAPLKPPGPEPQRRSFRHVRAAALLSAASLLNHLAWLGWDQERDIQPDGSSTGPYQAWQVIGVVLVLGVLAAIAGRSGHPVLGTLCLAGVFSLAWSVNAFLSDNSGLWVLGAMVLVPASFLGVALVAAIASSTRRLPQAAR